MRATDSSHGQSDLGNTDSDGDAQASGGDQELGAEPKLTDQQGMEATDQEVTLPDAADSSTAANQPNILLVITEVT